MLLAFIVLVGGYAPGVMAQTFEHDLQEILANRPERPQYKVKQESDPAPVEIERVAEVKTVFSGAIRLYQGTLSATDMDVCNFWPSCSRFGAASLHRHGLLKGGLLAADRLTRCHGLPSMALYYPFDPSTEKYLDPVEKYSDE